MTTIPTSHRDLLDAQVATLATLGDEGPQLSELWFLAEDDTVRLSLNTTRQKVKNLQRRPACSLLILDLANPYRYLEIRADAEIEPDHEYAFAGRLGGKYQADVRDNDGPGESRVVVTCIHVVFAHGASGYALGQRRHQMALSDAAACAPD